MLLGPMDYTPGAFRNVTPAEFKPQDKLPEVMTTRAQQLAMYVVYDSPLQVVADFPGAYRGEAGSEFLKIVPTSWDETRVLSGEIGEWIVVARRRGADWFVGAMTNEAARTLRVPLDFMARGAYEVQSFADGDSAATDPKQVSISNRRVKAGETLTIKLAPGGGFVARVRAVK
jgi:alpha-glucosidase